MQLSWYLKKGIVCIIILIVAQSAIAEQIFIPIPTRSPYVSEFSCDGAGNFTSPEETVTLVPGIHAVDSVWNCSVESVMITDEIQRTDNEFEADNRLRVERYTPDEGYVYLIITVDLQNHGDKEYCFDTSRFDLTLNKTKEQFFVHEVMDFLSDPFPAGSISPKEHVQGSIAFMVPPCATGYDLGIRLENRNILVLLLPDSTDSTDAG